MVMEESMNGGGGACDHGGIIAEEVEGLVKASARWALGLCGCCMVTQVGGEEEDEEEDRLKVPGSCWVVREKREEDEDDGWWCGWPWLGEDAGGGLGKWRRVQ